MPPVVMEDDSAIDLSFEAITPAMPAPAESGPPLPPLNPVIQLAPDLALPAEHGDHSSHVKMQDQLSRPVPPNSESA